MPIRGGKPCFFAFFLAVHNIDIHVVRVSPTFL